MPGSAKRFIDKRLEPSKEELHEKASFDLIRATINITVSALLISTATSMKLTLSTSYVTFMCAMGTSLADRAWGRDSAVYRVTGVLAMISGWFLTAVVAFSSAAIVALLLMWGGKFVMAGLLLLCVLALIKTSAMHKKRARKKQQIEAVTDVHKKGIIEKCNEDVYRVFEQMSRIYSETLQGLATENPKQLKSLYKEARTLYEMEKQKRELEMMPTLVKLQEDAVNTGHYYIQMLSYLYEISKSLLFITKASFEYIENNHTGLDENQANDLDKLNREVSEVYEGLARMLRTSDYTDFERILAKRDAIFDLFVENIKSQIKRVKSKESSTRNSMLFIDIVNETKTMLLQSRNMMRAQRLFVGLEESNKELKS
jgi:Na+/phosphate symporter